MALAESEGAVTNTLLYIAFTYAKIVQLKPAQTSSRVGATTALYNSICLDCELNTLSKLKVLVGAVGPSRSLTVTSRVSLFISTTLCPPLFFSYEFKGLEKIAVISLFVLQFTVYSCDRPLSFLTLIVSVVLNRKDKVKI